MDDPVRFVVTAGRSYELTVVNLGLACCAVEFVAAAVRDTALVRRVSGPGGRTSVLVVAGTVTDKAAPAVRALYDALPEPRAVLSFGACANTGGPYWDSYSVTKGVDQLLPVDLYVPGCPPRPEALLQALVQLQDRLEQPPGAPPTAPLVLGGAVGPQDLRGSA